MHSTASGLNQRPRLHGPIRVHERPHVTTPMAAGITYETYNRITHTVVIVEYTGV